MRPKQLTRILIVASLGVAASGLARAQIPSENADSRSRHQTPAEGWPIPNPPIRRDFHTTCIDGCCPRQPGASAREDRARAARLFFDRRLSADDKESCSTCHDPEKGFTDQLPTSMGIHNQFGKRNAPTIINANFNILQFWDGREPTLEEQAKRPILNPIEMGMPDEKTVVDKLNAAPEYQKAFMEVFGHPPNYEDMVKAIASFERTQVAFDSPFDKFMAGDAKTLTDQQQRGWSIFNGKGRCMSCHGVNPVQPMFSDNRFHNIGVSAHNKDFVGLARKGLAIIADGGNANEADR